MDVFAGDAKTPVLTVPRLRNGTTGGEIGFWARVNDQPLEWAAAISNLKITRLDAPVTLVPAANAPVEFIWNWQVSDPSPADDAVRSIPSSLTKWTAARAEESGLVNVNRLFSVHKQRSVVFAKHTLRSDAARRVLAGIGYRDDATVFVNGEAVYIGRNGWDSRTPQLNSFVDARWESVMLPLREGENEIVLAVADDQRFGWGFAVRIDNATGLKF